MLDGFWRFLQITAILLGGVIALMIVLAFVLIMVLCFA